MPKCEWRDVQLTVTPKDIILVVSATITLPVAGDSVLLFDPVTTLRHDTDTSPRRPARVTAAITLFMPLAAAKEKQHNEEKEHSTSLRQ